MTEPTPDELIVNPDDAAVTQHADIVSPADYVDPGEFEDFTEVDSLTVDSSTGAPQ
jgi:hypothetical protein